MNKTEQSRLRMQKMRNKKSVTSDSVTKDSVTSSSVTQERDMVPASYVEGITGRFKSLPKRPRYLTLSDKQVLDRLEQPKGNVSEDFIQRMKACNEGAYNFKPNQSSKEGIKELMKGI